MATYYKSAKVNRWKGTLDEIAELSAAVAREVELRTSRVPRYQSRIEGPALHAEFDDVQEMRMAIRVEDLRTLQKLSVTVGEWAEHTPLSASITFSRVAGEPAASVQTRGTDRVQVEGLLSATIQPYLDRGRRKLNLSNTLLYVISMLSILGLNAAVFSIPIDYPDVHIGVLWLAGAIIGGVIGVTVIMGINTFANWIYPQLELLAAGEETQFVRSRKWVYSGIVSAIVVPLLVALVLEWLTD